MWPSSTFTAPPHQFRSGMALPELEPPLAAVGTELSGIQLGRLYVDLEVVGSAPAIWVHH